MKKIVEKWNKILLGILFMLSILVSTSCEKDKIPSEKLYPVQFAVNALTVEKPTVSTKSGSAYQFLGMEFASVKPEDVTDVRIGITNMGTETLTVLPFSISQGITDVIKLTVGDYSLTTMQLLKETGPEEYEILYSAVASGAPLSQFVTEVVPKTFNIPLNSEVPISMDVVALDDWTPEDFGWAKFIVNDIVTVNPLYFYGATDGGSAATMDLYIFKDGVEISSAEYVNGRYKIYYPDFFDETDATEMLTFNLTMNGKQYQAVYSVAYLLSLPREVILLNVYGSGMFGFQELIYGSLGFNLVNSGPGYTSPFPAVFEVKNSSGVVVYEGGSPISYLDSPADDATEMYTIKITYSLWENGGGTWIPGQVKNASVSVSQIKAAAPTVSLDQWAGNNDPNKWWLFI